MGGQEFGRRDFFRLAGAVAFLAACGGPSVTPTPRPPTPEPTPTPEKAILWTQEIMIPPDSPSNKKPEAFFAQGNQIFFSNPQGYPVAYDLEGEKLWEWPEKGLVYGTEPGVTYVVRYDKRLYALDAQTSQTKWRAIFRVDQYTKVDWPLWIGQGVIFIPLERESLFFLATINKTDTVWPDKTISSDIQNVQIIGQVNQLFIFLTSSYLHHSIVANTFGSSRESAEFLWKYSDYDGGDKIMRKIQILGLSSKRIYIQLTESDGKYSRQYIAPLDLSTGISSWPPDNSYQYMTLKLVGEVEELTILNDKNLGYTYGIEASTGKRLWENDDLVLDRVVGISKDLLIGVRNNPNRLYGIDPKTGEPQWYWDLYQLTAQPVVHQDKIVYGSGPYLSVIDAETGRNTRNAPITLREGEASRLVPHGDLLLVQTGKTGRGTLSAIKI